MRTYLMACLLGLTMIGVTFAEVKSPLEVRSLKFTGGQYENEEFKYLLLPPAKIEPGKTYPLVLFLHGAGERGINAMGRLQAHFPSRMASDAYREKYPCFMIAPQCRPEQKWAEVDWSAKTPQPMADQPGEMMQMAIQILQESLKELPIDKQRVYLTGLSMGGYGSWELAARHPELFAAVSPICGGGDPAQAAQLAKLPLWAWHGDKDGAVPVERSRSMIEAIKAAGGEPKYTELPGVGHNAWDHAYGDEGMLPWMFEQRKAAE